MSNLSQLLETPTRTAVVAELVSLVDKVSKIVEPYVPEFGRILQKHMH